MSNQKKPDLVQVTVNPGGLAIFVPIGAVLLEALQAEGVPISSSCGGNGTCGTCRVFVQFPSVEQLPPRNEIEAEMHADRNFASNERLSCQHPVTKSLSVLIPERIKS